MKENDETTPEKKWAKDLIRQLPEDTWSQQTYESMLTFPSIRNADHPTRSTRSCLSEWLSIKHLITPRVVQGVEKQELLRTWIGTVMQEGNVVTFNKIEYLHTSSSCVFTSRYLPWGNLAHICKDTCTKVFNRLVIWGREK